jgi:putative sterol carrier protein
LLSRDVGSGEARSKDISDSMQAAAKLLGRGRDVGRLHVSVVGGRRNGQFTFDVLNGNCTVTESAAESPDLEVVVREDALVEIANGTLSPVDAYLSGRMEIAGDLEFGKRQYAKLLGRGSLGDLPV